MKEDARLSCSWNKLNEDTYPIRDLIAPLWIRGGKGGPLFINKVNGLNW